MSNDEDIDVDMGIQISNGKWLRDIKKSFKNQKQSSTKIFKRNTPSLPKEWIQLVKSNE